MHEIEISESPAGAIIPVHAQPGARRTQVVGAHGGAVKIAVRAKAEGGKANQALIDVIAKIMAVPKSSCEIIGGAAHRQKRVLVHGISAAAARSALQRAWPK
ncbi:MAG: DUF167 domain-containing protein [Planctomycetota bacterium]|nr:MAG: DUF167 domain-containing protein [Planctomycetota bacterium]